MGEDGTTLGRWQKMTLISWKCISAQLCVMRRKNTLFNHSTVSKVAFAEGMQRPFSERAIGNLNVIFVLAEALLSELLFLFSLAVAAILKRFPGRSCFVSLIWDCTVTLLGAFGMTFHQWSQDGSISPWLSLLQKPMSVADDYFCFLSVHMSFATFCTLAPSCLGLFTMEIFHSQPSENF